MADSGEPVEVSKYWLVHAHSTSKFFFAPAAEVSLAATSENACTTLRKIAKFLRAASELPCNPLTPHRCRSSPARRSSAYANVSIHRAPDQN